MAAYAPPADNRPDTGAPGSIKVAGHRLQNKQMVAVAFSCFSLALST
jgi:hypothetical protein